MREIELNEDEIKCLFQTGLFEYGFANRTIHLFDEGGGLEIAMNWQGEGYRPVKMSIEFIYDENIQFSEGEYYE